MGDIKVYDFKKIEKFSMDNIRFLSLMSEEFCKSSNLQIGYELKNKNLKLNMSETHQSSYGEFVENINHNCVIVEYKMKPLVNNLILSIDKYVALVIIDLILGGSADIKDIDRELTNIDIELLEYLIGKLLKRIHPLHGCESIEISQIYTNIAQFQKFKSNDSVFTSLINISLDGNGIGLIKLCIPYISMEPVINNLVHGKVDRENLIEENDGYDIYENEIFKYVKNIDIDIQATLGSSKIKIIDLLNLEQGDILLLDKKINEDITISVGESETYTGKIGLIGMKKGIEITDIMDREI